MSACTHCRVLGIWQRNHTFKENLEDIMSKFDLDYIF